MSDSANGGPPPETEFYAEPTPLTRRDAVGVAVALVALLLIGAGGYIWLNPELSLAGLLEPQQPAAGPAAARPAMPPPAGAQASQLAAPHTHAHDMSCPQCGMYADRSLAQVVAEWSDGTHTHHDCWDCAFAWGKAQDLELRRAVASAQGAPPAEPRWLDAAQATYLYDTAAIKGSMPPYTAAFADRAAAEAAQPELGGEIVDWEALQAKFGH